MKRLIPLLFACAAAHAAETLPAHVAGSWGSAQTVMYLQADGDGLMAGSTSSPAGLDGNARPRKRLAEAGRHAQCPGA